MPNPKFHTDSDQRKRLAAAGFVRVDGLMAWEGTRSWRINSDGEMSGKAGTNGLVTVIYAGCEVWVAGLSSPSDDEQVRLIGRLVAEFCHPGPEGRTAIVPLSNGEHSRTRDFLCRMADPNYEPAE